MRIIFRADGNSNVGLGHIMRSAALMHILQEKFECEFWTRDAEYFPFADFAGNPKVEALDAGSDLSAESRVLSESLTADDAIVLDGYHFETSYQNALRISGARIICIDDIMAYHFSADIIINHAGGIVAGDYSAEPYTQFFLGPAYALIRPVFHRFGGQSKDLKKRNIIVALGGADPKNDTDLVISKLIDSSFDQIHVMLGSANRHIEFLQAKYGNTGPVIFHKSLTGEEVAKLMDTCPYAVLSPSTVCYEYMSIGGVVYLYQIADNQEHIRRFFVEQGLAYDFGALDHLDAHEMQRSIDKQKEIFDGHSSERLLNIFSDLVTRN